MKHTAFLIMGIFAASLIGVAVAYFLAPPQSALVAPEPPIDEISQAPQPEPVVSQTPDSDLKQTGKQYQDPAQRYAFWYPASYQLDLQDSAHIRIFKLGATQQGQTEIYDGVIMVYEPIELQGRSVEEIVDERIQQSLADGTSQTLQPKKAVTLNGYTGFAYELRGLGSATYLVLQKNAGSNFALSITTSVSDPEKQNYQKEVDAVINSLEIQ